MTNSFIYRILLLMLIFSARPLMGMAGDGVIHRFNTCYTLKSMLPDTIPPAKKPADQEPEKTAPDIIKEVPRARKQVKPIALPVVPVKPIKIIRPKIIKRIL